MAHRRGTLLVLAASVGALIATSKEVPPAEVQSVTLEADLVLDAGEAVTYQLTASHGLDADARGYMTVYVGASVFAAPEDSTLSILLGEEGGDTGAYSLREDSLVLVSGTLVSHSDTYGLDAAPVMTLTAGDAGGLAGTLEVEVSVVLDRADTGEAIGELTAELVEVAE